MDCDVSWKTKLSPLHDENVLLKHQVESTVKERENIKLEFQRLFNSIKATRAQHQNEINEMFEDITQKTYAYADVRTDNQEKDEKQSQNDKTGLGMEKTVKDKAKSKPESQSSQKVNRKVNWSKSKSTQVNPGAKDKEI
ncbi:hypothetical protein Tco_0983291 [Tanacetum coccineum]